MGSCGEFFLIDWPRSAGAFDMRFIARPHVTFALMNGNGRIVAKAEPTARQGTQIDVKDLNKEGLIPPDAVELGLMVQTLPPGQYFLEAKGTPTRYWAVFPSREDPNRPQQIPTLFSFSITPVMALGYLKARRFSPASSNSACIRRRRWRMSLAGC